MGVGPPPVLPTAQVIVEAILLRHKHVKQRPHPAAGGQWAQRFGNRSVLPVWVAGLCYQSVLPVWVAGGLTTQAIPLLKADSDLATACGQRAIRRRPGSAGRVVRGSKMPPIDCMLDRTKITSARILARSNSL